MFSFKSSFTAHVSGKHKKMLHVCKSKLLYAICSFCAKFSVSSVSQMEILHIYIVLDEPEDSPNPADIKEQWILLTLKESTEKKFMTFFLLCAVGSSQLTATQFTTAVDQTIVNGSVPNFSDAKIYLSSRTGGNSGQVRLQV